MYTVESQSGKKIFAVLQLIVPTEQISTLKTVQIKPLESNYFEEKGIQENLSNVAFPAER